MTIMDGRSTGCDGYVRGGRSACAALEPGNGRGWFGYPGSLVDAVPAMVAGIRVEAESYVSCLEGSYCGDVEQRDSSLRSVKEVTGYHIEAKDGAMGHVEDFIADDENWTVRNMVADTRKWLPGKKVLIAPCLIQSVRWGELKKSTSTCAGTSSRPARSTIPRLRPFGNSRRRSATIVATRSTGNDSNANFGTGDVQQGLCR
jgi:hypothetical protein